MPVWWFLGATCAGKKTLIRALSEDRELREATLGTSEPCEPVWMEDGDEPVPIPKHGNALVRWQWGRTAKLRSLIGRDQRRHRLVLVETDTETLLQRIEEREGSLRWSERAMVDEAARVRALAERLRDKGAMLTVVHT